MLSSNSGASDRLLHCFMLGFAAPITILILALVGRALFTGNDYVMWGAPIIAGIGILVLFPFIRLAIVMAFVMAKAHWHRRHPKVMEYGITPPVCEACGYDLRASPRHCPECGAEVGVVDATIVHYLMSLRRRDLIEGAMAKGECKV